MDEITQLLKQLAGFLGGTPPVAGPPTPGMATAPGAPGGTGTQGLLGVLASSGLNLQQILQIISALGGANLGTDQINQLKQLYAQQQRAAAIAQNPALLAKRAAHAAIPIDKALAYNTVAAADAATTNRGMAQAPGAVIGGEVAALAPYTQHNLDLGAQFSEFGLPTGGFGAPNVPDYTSVLNELNTLGRNTGGGAYSMPAGTF